MHTRRGPVIDAYSAALLIMAADRVVQLDALHRNDMRSGPTLALMARHCRPCLEHDPHQYIEEASWA